MDELIGYGFDVYRQAGRVLRVVKDTGPRKRNVLLGLADERTISGMIEWGMLKQHGSKRGTTWGYGTLDHLAPGQRRRVEGAMRV